LRHGAKWVRRANAVPGIVPPLIHAMATRGGMFAMNFNPR